MILISSALGFGLILGPLLDAYSGAYSMVISMFRKGI